MILLLIIFSSAYLVTSIINRKGNRASYIDWYYFILENIKACKTDKDCYVCNELIGMYGDKFCRKGNYYTHDMYCLLITKLHDKGRDLMQVEVGTMTFEALLK